MSTQFQPDDKVSWTHSSSNGMSFRFRTRKGKFVRYAADSQAYGIVLYRGKEEMVSIKTLRVNGQKSALTEDFESIAESVCEGSTKT